MNDADKVNVLLVDDQAAKLLSYEVILRDLGQNLLKASSAREALEILLKKDVAVVLTDVCMPELDGFELTKMLRAHPRYESTAVIFISAVHLSEHDLARGYELGAVDYVSVPVVPEILRAKVRVFIELYRKSRELEQLNVQLEQRVRERTLELQDANGRLRESEERLRLASEAAGFGTYDYNVAGDRIHCSPHLKQLLGTDIEGELSLSAFLGLVHPDDKATVHDAMLSTGADEGARHEVEFRPAASAGGRWLLDRGSSVQVVNSPGKPTMRTMGTVLDITTRKQLEERQQLLIAELDHRVKNVMAIINAMARLSGRTARSVNGFIEALEGRLQSMANAHSLLRKNDWSSADLTELATNILAPFRADLAENIVLTGERLSLRPRAAQDLALVLHELATNAVKHGALSRPEGKVRVSWSCDRGSGATRIAWQESGGPPVREPERRGLGLAILQAAFADSGATVDCRFAETGLICTIEGTFRSGWGRVDTAVLNANRSQVRERVESGAHTPLRILLVEDEPLLAMQLQSDLEQEGHTVLGPASSLAAGLKLARAADLDFALLDVNLGGETSAEIAGVLAQRDIPFAFSTGYSDSANLPADLHDRPRLKKPYLYRDVQQVINGLVSDTGPRESAAKSISPVELPLPTRSSIS